MLHDVLFGVGIALGAVGVYHAVDSSDWAAKARAADATSNTPTYAAYGAAAGAGLVIGLVSHGVRHLMK